MATENKNLSQYNKETLPNVTAKRFGIITSEWNETVTEGMRKGVEKTLLDCGVLSENIIQWNVPGSFELVNGAKKMLSKEQIDAINEYVEEFNENLDKNNVYIEFSKTRTLEDNTECIIFNTIPKKHLVKSSLPEKLQNKL